MSETPQSPGLEPSELAMPELDAASVVRSYRANYVNLYGLWTKGTGIPEGASLMTPAEQPIEKLDLPAGLRDAMAQYQQSHPNTAMPVPVKYMRIVNGKPELVVEDERPLPEDQDLVSFSQTMTTTSLEEVSVVVDQVVATLNPDGGVATI
jgi:hypothetical protein